MQCDFYETMRILPTRLYHTTRCPRDIVTLAFYHRSETRLVRRLHTTTAPSPRMGLGFLWIHSVFTANLL